ncbi:hypothetical protein EVA_04393 [gut metagenome]|uniref:Uncharacterized protein n=1 Tax=gut metagenome TaxID=749906 RepID=J9H202_9ZZZZ
MAPISTKCIPAMSASDLNWSWTIVYCSQPIPNTLWKIVTAPESSTNSSVRMLTTVAFSFVPRTTDFQDVLPSAVSIQPSTRAMPWPTTCR